MAKAVSEKKPGKRNGKSPASYAGKEQKPAAQSKDNPSKYAPGKDVDMSLQSLDPEDGLVKLFTDSIKDIYWAENQLIKALPKMAKAAGNPPLKAAILDHLEQTKTHAARLETVFELLGKKVQAKKCDAMEGLTKEGEGIVEDTDKGTPARDLGIIMASQKVEHYEISAYSGLVALSARLGLAAASDLLSQTLTEEQGADDLLREIAEGILSGGETGD